MNTLSRNSLIGAFGLMALLSAPLAFAQSSAATPPAEAAAHAESSARPATSAQVATVAPQAGAAPAKKSWADVDANQDGSLTKSEASVVPALAQIFAQADGNADGTLTGDEYKAYVAKAQASAAGKDGGT